MTLLAKIASPLVTLLDVSGRALLWLLGAISGLDLARQALADLGQAKRVECGKENTTIIDGSGTAADIEAAVRSVCSDNRDMAAIVW